MGDTIKALDDSGKVGGYLVRFGDAAETDLQGDYFTPATDFGIDAWPAPSAVYYDHGYDPVLKRRRLAAATLTPDDVGVWVEAQLMLRDEYEKAIFDLVKRGKMGWSSGTAPHLVEWEKGEDIGEQVRARITRWPLGLDASITPTPAEWRNGAVPLKSLLITEFDDEPGAATPEDDTAMSSVSVGESDEDHAVPVPPITIEEGTKTMDANEPLVVPAAPDLSALVAEVKALRAAIEAEPAQNPVEIPNVNTKTKQGDDWQKATAFYFKTGDVSALGVKAYNDTDMNVGTAADGGYAVPTGLFQQITARADEDLLYPRLGVQKIPGKGLTVRAPVDAEADLIFATVAEGGDVLRDAPALSYVDFTLVKKGKHIQLTVELLRDEDAQLMTYIANWIGRGVAATHNTALVAAAIAGGTAGLTLDAAAAIGAPEIPELVGKLMPSYQNGAQWLIHPTTVAYLQGLSGNQFYFAPREQGYAGRPSLWGYPVNNTEYATALAASAKSLIFGNFNYMGMRAPTEMTMLRDPYTSAGTGGVKLWFWFDVVYGVLQAEAIQYATHPSA